MSSSLPPGPGGPEYLDSHGGGPMQPRSGSTGPRPGRRTGLIAGGVVSVLALGGVGAWAAMSFLSTGAQPAEALPDSTLAYLSVDLDPSGGQKIEALQTLRKFPVFKDQVGLDTDDDVRKRIFEALQDGSPCDDVDFDDDVAPWLGDRMAVAAVDTGNDTPTPVFVVQVSDEEGADAGLTKLAECGDGGERTAWAIDDGWALVGESQGTVDEIAADAADAPLAEDADYSRWTEAAGEPGIATGYLAPDAGKVLADHLDRFMSPFPAQVADSGTASPASLTPGDDDCGTGSPFPSEVTDALEDFGGLGLAVRFDDGALELEVAADGGGSQEALPDTDGGDDVLSTLPEDTALAVGVGFADGWFGDWVDGLARTCGAGMSAEELLAQLSAESGLDLPDDAEILAGESAAVAVGAGLDPEQVFGSGDGSDVPIGLKIQGDPDRIESVLDKLRPQLGGQEALLGSDSDGDLVAIGPDEDYRAELLEDGGLGGSEVFRNAVREAGDAAAVLFVNLDVAHGWVGELDEDPQVAENLEPLQGLGVSTWLDDGAGHLVLRLTTD